MYQLNINMLINMTSKVQFKIYHNGEGHVDYGSNDIIL
jgi:hypothetical protein